MTDIAAEDFWFFDTETTGLHPETDEVLELAVIDGEYNELVNERFRPARLTSWDEASRINGIWPRDVADREPLIRARNRLKDLFDGRNLVAYNAAFDAAFLKACLGGASLFCCMNAWTHYYGERQRLTAAVNFIDPCFYDEYALAAHTAIADAKACGMVWKWLLKNNPEILQKPDVKLDLRRKKRA